MCETIERYGMEKNRQIAIEFIEEGLLHNNIDFIKKYVNENYIQHDAMVEDGRSGLIKLMQVTEFIPFKRTTILKTIMDQDCIAIIRAIGILFVKVSCIDIVRIENGLIQEHWDCIQLGDAFTNLIQNNSQVISPEEIKANKDRVIKQIESRTIIADLKKVDTAFNQLELIKLHQVFGEGNLVLAVIEWRDKNKVIKSNVIFAIDEMTISPICILRQNIPQKAKNNNGSF